MFKINLEDTNYRAKIVQLKEPRKHSGADRLICWNIDFQQVITNLDYKEGDVVIYFPVECCVNKDLISFIDGFEDKTLNKNPENKGFFNKHGRVRAISLRKEKSQGCVLPISVIFAFLNKECKYEINQEFDSFNDIVLCKKYIAFIKERNNNIKSDKKVVKKISRLVENQFRLHNDTENLRRNSEKINPEDFIGIHYKKHGTSFVVGNVLVKKKLKWYEEVLKKLKIDINQTEYDYVYSSRKVVKNEFETQNVNGFYNEDIWGVVKEELVGKILKGYTLYGEIIGFLPSGGAIQGEYDYGCQKGEHKTYIYRITVTNIDGQVIELDDLQIKQYCEKFNLLYKDTFIYYGKAKDLYPHLDASNHWNEEFVKQLEVDYNEKDCYMCVNKLPEEGIVLRKVNLFDYQAFKLKSARFLEWETKELDKETINIEECQNV